MFCLLSACEPGHDPEEGGDWMPHAELLNDPELTAFPTRRVPPPAPLRAPNDRPDIAVYGYWPYWGDPLDTLYWDQLTHVAIFSAGLNSNGTLNSLSTWTNNAARAVQLAAPYGVKVHLCMTSFYDANTNAVLSSPALRATAIANLAAQVNAYGAHGVNVDIEGLDASQFNNMVSFITELQAAVPEVWIAMPAVDWSGAFDYDALANIADGLFIMGYDYHWSGGGPGPIAPLNGGAPWAVHSISWTVDDYLRSGADPHKMTVGLPLYGRDWPTTGNNIPGTSTGSATSLVYSQTASSGPAYGRRYDTQTQTPYAFPSGTHQMWYDDQQSLDAKIQYAVDRGLQGIGFWALTYEDSDPAFWQMVDSKSHSACPDSDGDGSDDCTESCDADPAKTAPGVCGCGTADSNADGDGLLDCQETCDADPAKTAPGVCGCGVSDNNTDGDALLDCQETCDTDPAKTAPGVCGCGVSDANADGDGLLDCQETCDADPAKTAPGVCGCGVSDNNTDGDALLDCQETCDLDPAKTAPGTCGCGLPDEDITGDGVADCTVCGDGVVVAPETCDDGARTNGDGCTQRCQVEPMDFLPVAPGTAGVTNTFTARAIPTGDNVLFLASSTLGNSRVPGCPGLTIPLLRPSLIGTAAAMAGQASLSTAVPGNARGHTFAIMAIDLTACRVSDIETTTFR